MNTEYRNLSVSLSGRKSIWGKVIMNIFRKNLYDISQKSWFGQKGFYLVEVSIADHSLYLEQSENYRLTINK